MDDRFSRHQYLPDWDQGRLGKATVHPIQLRVECPRCGLTETRPGALPTTASQCPQCATVLRSRTTLELTKLPPHVRFTDLAIPAREILAVRTAAGMEFIELGEHGK